MAIENLKCYLANRNMTNKEFSKLIDYNEFYLSHIIHGNKLPGKKLIRKIYEATNGLVDESKISNKHKYKKHENS